MLAIPTTLCAFLDAIFTKTRNTEGLTKLFVETHACTASDTLYGHQTSNL